MANTADVTISTTDKCFRYRSFADVILSATVSCYSNSREPIVTEEGVIGGFFVVAIVVFLMLIRREKRRMKEYFDKNGGPILKDVNNIKIFKKDELKPILKAFNIIGKGGFGEVYKGLLSDQQVAVKKPINVDVAQKEQFANEVIIQSCVIHKNIVKLIGCCLEVDVPMLVYEFISKGSLDNILHGDNEKLLSLGQCLSIAAESAEGLAYMHSKANVTIMHGDVKPANILLDDEYVPKISDFGISRLIAIDKAQHTNYVIGDKSYMDPIYLQTGLLTNKSDVYSFGVVLLELISRKKATYTDNNKLVTNFVDAHKTKSITTEFFDKEITTSTKDIEVLECLAGIAVECLQLDVDQRPEMTDASSHVEEILCDLSSAPLPACRCSYPQTLKLMMPIKARLALKYSVNFFVFASTGLNISGRRNNGETREQAGVARGDFVGNVQRKAIAPRITLARLRRGAWASGTVNN
ncbi:hypothetical protein EJB05_34300, partial [Eragrostis curvula]